MVYRLPGLFTSTALVRVVIECLYLTATAQKSAECNTDYHNNFTVHNRERTYYENVPLYVQVGEHQFFEQKVIRAWINNMLIAWYDKSLRNIEDTILILAPICKGYLPQMLQKHMK